MKEFIILIPTVINTISVSGILIICLLELNSATNKRKPMKRIQYVILMVGAMLSGFQPMLWATIPSMGTALLSVSLLLFLLIHCTKRKTHHE